MADGVEKTAEEKAASLKDEGNEKFKSKDYKAAVELYSSALELDPSQHTFYSNRSACHMELKNYEEALADAQKCVELKPSWAKGYNRTTTAFQALKQWDKAIDACSEGIKNVTEDKASLEKKMCEVNKGKFQDELIGDWHGKVSQEFGGYDQEFVFKKDGSLEVKVLGNGCDGWWRLASGADKEPWHMDVQVVPPGGPPGFMPPAVQYIARIDEQGLHLCTPFMTQQRPTDFSGPGYCLMAKGKLQEEANDADLAGLSKIEKVRLCMKELIAILPKTRIEEPSQDDPESMMIGVKLQSGMFNLQKRFGQEIMTEAMEAGKDYGSLDVRSLAEAKELREAMRVCGLFGDEEPTSRSQASSGPKTQAPPAESSSAPTPSAKAPETPAEKVEESLDLTTVAVAAVAVAAVASLAFVLWRRQRR
jgi:tetratricopeptide (TPR) repeat protein